jgi:hypothetical protein
MKETHVAPTFYVLSHVCLGAKKLTIFRFSLGFLVVSVGVEPLSSLAAGP